MIKNELKIPGEAILLTAGELAKLSQSTKRTVLWYTKEGLLKPVKINSKGYRFYSSQQIIDFQVIMLLRSLNFSLVEIKKLLRKNASLKEIFQTKEELVQQEIFRLQNITSKIKEYYQSYQSHGTLITPTVKEVKSFEIYFLQKIGPYAKIYDYSFELKSYFSQIPQDATFLVIFLEDTYAPKKDIFKVAVIKTPGMRLKKDAEGIVQHEIVPGFTSLSYTHIGSPALISMIWMNLEQYLRENGFKKDDSLGFHTLEFYKKTALNDLHDDNQMVSELNHPII
jgi:DNA-binding transcriptional MerR regulator